MPRTAKKPSTPYAGGSGQSAAPVTPARVQPVTVPTGLQYGEAKALADAQKQLPLPGSPTPVPASTPTPATASPQPQADFASALQAAQQDTQPPVNLGAASSRPHEPVTAGLPSGPGPGPEALSMPTATPPATLGDLLQRLAATNPDAAYLYSVTARGGR